MSSHSFQFQFRSGIFTGIVVVGVVIAVDSLSFFFIILLFNFFHFLAITLTFITWQCVWQAKRNALIHIKCGDRLKNVRSCYMGEMKRKISMFVILLRLHELVQCYEAHSMLPDDYRNRFLIISLYFWYIFYFYICAYFNNLFINWCVSSATVNRQTNKQDNFGRKSE